MWNPGVAERFVKVVQDIYETVLSCPVGVTDGFKVREGLHQGSALSPFAVVMDRLTDEFSLESLWTVMRGAAVKACLFLLALSLVSSSCYIFCSHLLPVKKSKKITPPYLLTHTPEHRASSSFPQQPDPDCRCTQILFTVHKCVN